ncbi:MAG TPA: site-specific integrase, partial [Gammaproteobacteria bacterium]|nr:site-specific integrase [Gammaproteobacteria bacterium]
VIDARRCEGPLLGHTAAATTTFGLRPLGLRQRTVITMPYQYKREPLTPDEANRLANACQTHEEKLVVWTLLDTGLRVSELASLTKNNLDWQNHRLMIYGKGGPL